MKTATAKGQYMAQSLKKSVEVCSFVRGLELERAKKQLKGVIEKKVAVPFRRYNEGAGHKSGKIAAGKYPIKVCSNVLEILKNAENNAVSKGLVAPFIIKEIRASQGPSNWKMSRIRGRKRKSTHIYVTLVESQKKSEKKEEKKTEVKKETTEKKTETKENKKTEKKQEEKTGVNKK